jgi:hypothetical protein
MMITGKPDSSLSARISLKHFPAVLARHVEVQQQQIRLRLILIRRLAAQESHGFHTVLHMVKVRQEFSLAHDFLDQPGIGKVVFSQQDVQA